MAISTISINLNESSLIQKQLLLLLLSLCGFYCLLLWCHESPWTPAVLNSYLPLCCLSPAKSVAAFSQCVQAEVEAWFIPVHDW